MRKRLLGALLALVMIFAALPVIHAAGADDVPDIATVTPRAGDGVTLDYDEEGFSLEVTELFGVYRVAESKTLTLTASFGEGWTYNAKYTNFFKDHPERVTVTDGANGSKVFTFNAQAGDLLSPDELDTVGVYASAAELPKLNITTSVPFSQIGKENYVEASFSLTLGTKQFSSGNYEGTGSIKGRGNTSWGQPKKPYSIKLDSKKSLLDIPKTKKYAIIPSYSDNSLMRNFMTYKASLMLEGYGYVPKCEFVEVYLNGVYNGIYILVERVSIESNKIDIEEATEEDLTGGYLIEKDIDGKIDYDADQWFNCPYWANQSRDYFVLKEPEPEDSALRDQMLSYLTNYMQDLHNAVMGISSEPYTKYVDVPSWADFTILQELAKNIDGNLKTSCYMIKQSGDDKLYMTAPWDFDLAFGNPATTWNNADHAHNDYDDCPDATGTSSFMVINSSCPWIDTLYDDHPDFQNAVKSRYAGYRHTLVPEMLSLMDSQAAYLAEAMPRDEQKWGVRFENGWTQLNNWFKGRVEWLDSVWLEDQDGIDVDFALNADGGSLHFTNGAIPFRGVVKDGRIAAVSTNTADNSESSFSINLAMQAGDTLSFDYKVSSEQGYDRLCFYVDGTKKLEASGEEGWTGFTYTADTSGTKTLEWKYKKDQSWAGGADCAWIDDVRFTGGQPSNPTGDANSDGTVDVSDALLVLRYAMSLIPASSLDVNNCDVDSSGAVDVNDALIILRRAMSLR